MSIIHSKALQVTKFFADANFYISVIVLIYGGLTAITENYSVFEFNEELFGVMHNNLRIALLYLGMTEVVVCLYCFVTNQPRLMIFVGYFLIMMLGSLAFYGKINSVTIDNAIPVFFLYTGISHIVFGLLSGLRTCFKGNQYKKIFLIGRTGQQRILAISNSIITSIGQYERITST